MRRRLRTRPRDLAPRSLSSTTTKPASELSGTFSSTGGQGGAVVVASPLRDNQFASSAPSDLEALAPCDGQGSGNWSAGALDVAALTGTQRPPASDYKVAPVPAEHESMPDAESARAPVLIGVGAAFDFHAGIKRQAPHWMQRAGLEWAFRLANEPRRLAGRYVRNNPRFVWMIAREALSVRTGRIQHPVITSRLTQPDRNTWQKRRNLEE